MRAILKDNVHSNNSCTEDNPKENNQNMVYKIPQATFQHLMHNVVFISDACL
jgi:hypothetical protein